MRVATARIGGWIAAPDQRLDCGAAASREEDADLPGGGRQVILWRDDQQDAASFVGPQLAVVAAGVGVMEVAGADAPAAGDEASMVFGGPSAD